MELKKVVLNSNRISVGVLLLAATIVLYVFPNNFYFNTPALVPLTVFDQLVPLSATWTWCYVSYYFFLIFVFLKIRDEEVLNRLAYSFLAAGISGALLFFFLPTTILRELYPVAESGLSAQMLLFIRSIDQSQNCAPSMHIAFTAVGVVHFCKDNMDNKIKCFLITLWALLISYSTMATKQHYFLDVVSGLFLGTLISSFFSKTKVTNQAVQTSDQIALP